jgi:hypothetical protein
MRVKFVDPSHLMNVQAPGSVGYADNTASGAVASGLDGR